MKTLIIFYYLIFENKNKKKNKKNILYTPHVDAPKILNASFMMFKMYNVYFPNGERGNRWPIFTIQLR